MIVLCGKCKSHEYQDRKYGAGMRVANIMKDPTKARCTVCSNIISVQKQVVIETEKK